MFKLHTDHKVKSWTPAEEARLIELRNEGKVYKVIAVELGRPYRSVKDKAWRLGLDDPGAWTKAQDDYLIANHECLTHVEMAAHLGTQRRKVRNRLIKLGLHVPRTNATLAANRIEDLADALANEPVDDDEYVVLCLRQGGFVAREIVGGVLYEIRPKIPPPPRVQPNESARDIAERVAKAHGLRLEDLQGRAMSRHVVAARQEAMAAVFATGRYSLTWVGEFFGGRHHTTVTNAVRGILDRCAA